MIEDRRLPRPILVLFCVMCIAAVYWLWYSFPGRITGHWLYSLLLSLIVLPSGLYVFLRKRGKPKEPSSQPGREAR